MTSRRIRTVDELVKALRQGPGEKGYLPILERIDIPVEEIEPWCTWSQKQYTRNCIDRTTDFELLLICYEPGQRTSIHDYATGEAWVHPIAGQVIEERYESGPGGNLRKISAAKLDKGSFSYMNKARSIHRYINPETERSITLNLYAPPLRTWKVYDERSGDPSIQEIDT